MEDLFDTFSHKGEGQVCPTLAGCGTTKHPGTPHPTRITQHRVNWAQSPGSHCQDPRSLGDLLGPHRVMSLTGKGRHELEVRRDGGRGI